MHYWRLGYGGGYFDRTIAGLRTIKPNVVCIGVGYDWQQLKPNQWQAEAHDEPLDAMLTESGLCLKGA
jgi:5-formyltetrahydrofolate cyclo-ligase